MKVYCVFEKGEYLTFHCVFSSIIKAHAWLKWFDGEGCHLMDLSENYEYWGRSEVEFFIQTMEVDEKDETHNQY